MAGYDMSRRYLEELAQREELVKEREKAGDQPKVGKRMVRKREMTAMIPERGVKGWEGAQQEKSKAMKEEGELEKREEELLKRKRVLEQPDEQQKRIRASAAGSSSPPCEPPPPVPSTHIHQLPDEVLAQIFSLLNLKTIVKVLAVCQRWWGVIEGQNVNKKLKFERGTFSVQEALCLIHSAPKLKSLELIHRSDALALLNAASARCTNLLHLSVNCGNFRILSLTDSLKKVFWSSRHITDLRLIYVSTSENVSFYHQVGTALPDLRKLEFNIKGLSDLQFSSLINGCSRNQIEELKTPFSTCLKETIPKVVKFWGRSLRVLDMDVTKLTDGDLALLAACTELRQLKLSNSFVHGNWLYVMTPLSHLEVFCVSNGIGGIPENWCFFFSESKSSQRFHTLSLSGSFAVNDMVLATVAASCPQLEDLKITSFKVTISGVREVLRCCRKLHNLVVDYTDASVAYIVPELPRLAPQLRRIYIGYRGKQALGMATLRHVQAQMPHLWIG